MKYIFVVGRVASGKSTYVKSIQQEGDVVIELGQIVRDYYKTEKRVFDANLDKVILEEVTKVVNDKKGQISRLILVAARSCSLVQELLTLPTKEDQIEFHLLEVPEIICRNRFKKAKRKKDKDMTYDDALKGDVSIGMEELIDWLYDNEYNMMVYRIANYTPEEFNACNFEDVTRCPHCGNKTTWCNDFMESDVTGLDIKEEDNRVITEMMCSNCERISEFYH